MNFKYLLKSSCKVLSKLFRVKNNKSGSLCAQLNLEEQVGKSLESIVFDVESLLKNKLKTTQKLKTRFKLMGGANNLGMLLHCGVDGNPIYISKIEGCYLAGRELNFLEWQNQIPAQQHVAPALLGQLKLGGNNFCALVMQALKPPLVYDATKVIDLYQRMGHLSGSVARLDHTEAEKLRILPIEPNTKITKVIHYVVSQLHNEQAFDYAAKFLDERSLSFKGYESEFAQIYDFTVSLKSITQDFDRNLYYGLLHGDFKKSNILEDAQGVFKVVDLQYYSYGVRLWDMAFYCSKETSHFEISYEDLIKPLRLNPQQQKVFLLLYILASLLHVNQKNIKKILRKKVKPAYALLNGQ